MSNILPDATVHDIMSFHTTITVAPTHPVFQNTAVSPRLPGLVQQSRHRNCIDLKLCEFAHQPSGCSNVDPRSHGEAPDGKT